MELRREGGTVYEMDCWNESIPSIDHNDFRVNKLYVTVSNNSGAAGSVSTLKGKICLYFLIEKFSFLIPVTESKRNISSRFSSQTLSHFVLQNLHQIRAILLPL